MEHSFNKLGQLQSSNALTFDFNKSENRVDVTAKIASQNCASAQLIFEENKIFLKKISVAAEFQNKGIGSQLLSFCEELARNNNCEIIYAQAQENVGRSVINFYTKNEYFCGDEVFFEDAVAYKIVWKFLN